MTIGCPEFDGDSHTSVRYFLGMTALFVACVHLYKFQFVCLPREAGEKSAPKVI